MLSRSAVLPKNVGCWEGGYRGVCSAGGGGGAVRLASALSQCITDGCSAASQDGSVPGRRLSADTVDSRQGPRVTVVASTEAVEDVAAPLRRCFTHELHIDAPDKHARLSILEVWRLCPSSLCCNALTVQMQCSSCPQR